MDAQIWFISTRFILSLIFYFIYQHYLHYQQISFNQIQCPSYYMTPMFNKDWTAQRKKLEYYNQVKIYHPDKNRNCQQNATQKFIELKELFQKKK